MLVLAGTAVAAVLWCAGRERPAIAIARRMCDGLDAAHAVHVLHGHVRPANVVISRSGAVKVGDFGFAPVPAIDERDDVHGVGTVLFELLAGHVPPDLDPILRRARADDRARRHDSCAELERDLARVAHALGLELTDRQIGTWIVREIAGWSPTLRGW